MTSSTLYIKAADKLRDLGYSPDSRKSVIVMIQKELGYCASAKELLDNFMDYQPKKLIDRGAYKMPVGLRLASARAAKYQPEFITLGGKGYVSLY